MKGLFPRQHTLVPLLSFFLALVYGMISFEHPKERYCVAVAMGNTECVQFTNNAWKTGLGEHSGASDCRLEKSSPNRAMGLTPDLQGEVTFVRHEPTRNQPPPASIKSPNKPDHLLRASALLYIIKVELRI